MSERRKLRRHQPRVEPLNYAVQCQTALEQDLKAREWERGHAFLAAASAGWSMREIAERTGLSASTVCRIINDHDVEEVA